MSIPIVQKQIKGYRLELKTQFNNIELTVQYCI